MRKIGENELLWIKKLSKAMSPIDEWKREVGENMELLSIQKRGQLEGF
jgi:hypothetical protein